MRWLKNNYLLLFILLMAAVLRFYNIDFQSAWLDEIHTLNETNPDIPFFKLHEAINAGEQMPVLYFYLVYFLFKIFGYSLVIARAFSAILGILSIYSIFLLGRELYNKKVGVLSALLLAVNGFHIYHSQEARPYMLFLLFGILSFYQLLLFIKKRNLKHSILYGLSAGLMIATHFFGLFVLMSQIVIMAVVFLYMNLQQKKVFAVRSLISGFITILLFLPSINIFKRVSEIKDFWIPAPTENSLSTIFREFYGNSETVLSLVYIFIILYFISVTKAQTIKQNYKTLIQDKKTFGFLFLMLWIVLVVFVPYLRSYLSVPMLISRYFFIILPALCIILSAGIIEFKNKAIQFGLAGLFTIFSITHIVVVQKYYNAVSKSQFREAIGFINNYNNDLVVVSSLGWYVPYYLDNKNTAVYHEDINAYVNQIKKDTINMKSFWWFEGHNRTFDPLPDVKDYLDKNYIATKEFLGYDVHTKLFQPIYKVDFLYDISEFDLTVSQDGDSFGFSIENFMMHDHTITISGWAFFERLDATETEIEILAIKDAKAYKLFRKNTPRPDVTNYFSSKSNLNNSGFEVSFNTGVLEAGQYTVAIVLTNKKHAKKGIIITDKIFNK